MGYLYRYSATNDSELTASNPIKTRNSEFILKSNAGCFQFVSPLSWRPFSSECQSGYTFRSHFLYSRRVHTALITQFITSLKSNKMTQFVFPATRQITKIIEINLLSTLYLWRFPILSTYNIAKNQAHPATTYHPSFLHPNNRIFSIKACFTRSGSAPDQPGAVAADIGSYMLQNPAYTMLFYDISIEKRTKALQHLPPRNVTPSVGCLFVSFGKRPSFSPTA